MYAYYVTLEIYATTVPRSWICKWDNKRVPELNEKNWNEKV